MGRIPRYNPRSKREADHVCAAALIVGEVLYPVV